MSNNKIFQNLFFFYLYLYTIWPNYISLQIGTFPGINFPKIMAVILFLYWVRLILKNNQLSKIYSANFKKIKKYLWVLIAYLLFIFLLTILFHFEIRKLVNLFIRYSNGLLIICIVASLDNITFRRKLFVNLTKILFIVSVIGITEFLVGKNIYSFIFSAKTIYAAETLNVIQTGSLYRITSCFSHNLNLAQFYIIIIPFVFFLGNTYFKKVKKRLWFYIFFSIGASLLTFSRALYVSYFAFFIIELIYLTPKSAILNFLRILFASLFIILLVYINFNIEILNDISIEYRGKPLTEDVHREGQIIEAIPLISNNLYQGYGITEAAQILDYGSLDGTPTVDNHYISIALESGIIAVIFIFIFYLIITIKAFRVNKYLAMSAFGFLFQSFTLSNLESHIYFYLIAGIILLTTRKSLRPISYA